MIGPKPTVAQLVMGDGTPKKAFYTAMVVGTLLIAINHGDAILGGVWPPTIKIILTYCVPYCVTSWGAAFGKLSEWERLDS